MPSYAQQFQYECARCRHRGQCEVWLAVDIQQRPDVAQLIASGAVTTPRYGSCGSPVTVEGQPSLLVRRPHLRPPLLFATAVQVPQEQLNRQFQLGLMLLRQGEPPHTQVQQEVQILPYHLMPAVLERDVESDLAELAAGTFRAATPPLQEYQAWLSDLLRHRQERQLMAALSALLEAPDAATWRRTVLANPLLLTDPADEVLQVTIMQVEQAGQAELAAHARNTLGLLRRCREIGIDRVVPA